MPVLFFRRAVELQISTMQAGFLRLAQEVLVLREADAVGGGQYSIESDLLCVPDGIEEMRRKRRLSSRKQNDDLTARLK